MEMFYSLIWVVTCISKNVLSCKIKIYALYVIYNSKKWRKERRFPMKGKLERKQCVMWRRFQAISQQVTLA